jgi:hypothetical protein
MSRKMPSIWRIRQEYLNQEYDIYVGYDVALWLRSCQSGKHGVSEVLRRLQNTFVSYGHPKPGHETLFSSSSALQRHAYAELLVPRDAEAKHHRVLGYCWFTRRWQFLPLSEWRRRASLATTPAARPP